jgi:hypothetical protein
MNFSDTYNRIANQKPPSRRGPINGLAAPFPACSPAAVQSHQRALPMLRAWIEHIRADVKAGLTPYDSSFDEALRLVDQIDPSHRDEVR